MQSLAVIKGSTPHVPMSPPNRLVVAAAVVLLLTLTACSPTRFTSVWQHPDATFGQMNGEKIAAFLISNDEGHRRQVENLLAGELSSRGADGVPGYTLLSKADAQDKNVAKRKLQDAGVKAVITLRIVSEKDRTSSTPGTWHQVPTYSRWNGYWVRGWKTVYAPGYSYSEQVVTVETLIYELQSEGLIWAGLSETVEPGKADRFVPRFAKAIDDAIRKSSLLK